MPRFFLYAKDKEEKNVEPYTSSFVNKLSLKSFIPDIVVRYSVSRYGRLIFDEIVKNKDIRVDKKILERYKELNRTLRNKIKKQDKYNDNGSYIRQLYMNQIRGDSGYSDDDIADMLIRALVFETDSVCQDLMWFCYGDIIYQHICENINGKESICEKCGCHYTKTGNNQKQCQYCIDHPTVMAYKHIACKDCDKMLRVPSKNNKTVRCAECQKKADYEEMETKKILCEKCGKQIVVKSKDNNTTMCVSCYSEYRHMRKMLSQDISRETQKLLRLNGCDLTYIISTYKDINGESINIDRVDALIFALIIINLDEDFRFNVNALRSTNSFIKRHDDSFQSTLTKLCTVGLLHRCEDSCVVDFLAIKRVKDAQLSFYKECYKAIITPSAWRKQVEYRLRHKQ